MLRLALTCLLILGADKKPKLDLGLKLDKGDEIPKGENLQKPKEKKIQTESTTTLTELTYTVVRVAHAKNFNRGPNGAIAAPALEAIPASGNPFTTDRFTSVVRVKCPQKLSAPIELQVLDNRTNEMMSGSGTIYFRGEKQDEADYTLDWDPTPLKPGDYSFLVKVGGNVLGTYPLKVVDKNAPKGDAGR